MSGASVLVIAGPTASGKSGLALQVAAATPAVIINADSLQLYKGLPLLTAQPSDADKAQAPHALYTVLDPADTCSAARWRDMALGEIEKAHAAKRLPIITGGTGFYIRALTDGLSPIPDVPDDIRDAAIAKQKELGNPAFHAALAKRDPATTAKLDPFNTQRLVRAWEVLEATGRPLADWQGAPPVPPPAHLKFTTAVLLPPRDALYRNCEARFDAMMDAGALDEAAAFKNPGSPLEAALGYKQLTSYLAGETSLGDAVSASKQATRNYAKRQTTWLRNQMAPDITLEKPDTPAILKLMGL